MNNKKKRGRPRVIVSDEVFESFDDLGVLLLDRLEEVVDGDIGDLSGADHLDDIINDIKQALDKI